MKKKTVLIPIVVFVALLLVGAGIWKTNQNGLRLSAVESYEVGYQQPVLVYQLVEQLNHRDRAVLTLSGKGEIGEDGQTITFPKVGHYKVTVRAKDGLYAEEATTTVHVVDHIPPTLNAENFSIALGEVPDYLGHVTATDEMDGDLIANVRVDSSQVSLEEKGRYEVKYTVVDASGNAAAATSYLTICQTPAASISLDEKKVWLAGNEYKQLEALVTPSDWEGSVRWESSDPSVCDVNDGLVVWKGEGKCTVTAIADDVSAECVVQCEKTQLTTVWLNQHTLDLAEYQTARLSCDTYPSNWEGSVKWSTSNSSVATVDKGVVTWVGPGTCTIVASNSGIADQCQVTCAGKTWTDRLWEFLGGSGDEQQTEQNTNHQSNHNSGGHNRTNRR